MPIGVLFFTTETTALESLNTQKNTREEMHYGKTWISSHGCTCRGMILYVCYVKENIVNIDLCSYVSCVKSLV